ncbi:hypothetical protein D3C72_1320300 [compost metagenome]
MNDLAGDIGCDVETLGDVAIFGLAAQVAVGVGLGAGQGHALANLDQCRHAIGSLDLLNSAVAAIGTAIDDAGLVGLCTVHRVTLIALEVVFVGIDGNQQAFWRSIELANQGLKFVDFALISVDDELIAIGADGAVLADEILRHGQHVGTGVVIQRHDFSGCHDRKTAGHQQCGEQGA